MWRPAWANTFDVFTSEVQDSRPAPTANPELLNKFINYKKHTLGVSNRLACDRAAQELTTDFPVPVAPVTLSNVLNTTNR